MSRQVNVYNSDACANTEPIVYCHTDRVAIACSRLVGQSHHTFETVTKIITFRFTESKYKQNILCEFLSQFTIVCHNGKSVCCFLFDRSKKNGCW